MNRTKDDSGIIVLAWRVLQKLDHTIEAWVQHIIEEIESDQCDR